MCSSSIGHSPAASFFARSTSVPSIGFSARGGSSLVATMTTAIAMAAAIVGAICIYILMGLAWAFAYIGCEILFPGSLKGFTDVAWQDNLQEAFYYLGTRPADFRSGTVDLDLIADIEDYYDDEHDREEGGGGEGEAARGVGKGEKGGGGEEQEVAGRARQVEASRG